MSPPPQLSPTPPQRLESPGYDSSPVFVRRTSLAGSAGNHDYEEDDGFLDVYDESAEVSRRKRSNPGFPRRRWRLAAL